MCVCVCVSGSMNMPPHLCVYVGRFVAVLDIVIQLKTCNIQQSPPHTHTHTKCLDFLKNESEKGQVLDH